MGPPLYPVTGPLDLFSEMLVRTNAAVSHLLTPREHVVDTLFDVELLPAGALVWAAPFYRVLTCKACRTAHGCVIPLSLHLI